MRFQPLTILEQFCSDPNTVTFQQDAIDAIAVSGLDIWNRSNVRSTNSHLFCKQQALQEYQYTAQASTQHNNNEEEHLLVGET
jgi:hypothetical protein